MPCIVLALRFILARKVSLQYDDLNSKALLVLQVLQECGHSFLTWSSEHLPVQAHIIQSIFRSMQLSAKLQFKTYHKSAHVEQEILVTLILKKKSVKYIKFITNFITLDGNIYCSCVQDLMGFNNLCRFSTIVVVIIIIDARSLLLENKLMQKTQG